MIDKVSSCLRNISIKPFQNNEIEKQSSDVLKNNTKMQNTSDAMTGVPLMKYRNISFKGYYGDEQPLKKLFWISTGRNKVYADNWTNEHIYTAQSKKWVNARPEELLRRTPENTIQSLCTVVSDSSNPHIPSYIPSPDFGNNWGRHANYIEINPRVIAKYENGRVSDGLLNTMKLMLAVPPSSNSFANCIVLSQLYPCFDNDGKSDAGSLYCTDLHRGISKALTAQGLKYKMGDDEQVKAFNDMAHLLGFKTGFRLPLSSGQIHVKGKDFDWKKDEKAFIDACVWGIELGFDSIYFDSGKHIIDTNGYCGSGDVPDREQLAYILYKIREQTGRHDISFVGEKCGDNMAYKNLGFSAGTDWGNAGNFKEIKWNAKSQSFSKEYAAGPEVSNDNDCGSDSFETRLNKMNSCLFAYEDVKDKLPSFMQMHDIFPLSPYTNTHSLMLHSKQMKGSDAWTECERHYDGIFNTSLEAQNYRQRVYHIFENVYRQ